MTHPSRSDVPRRHPASRISLADAAAHATASRRNEGRSPYGLPVYFLVAATLAVTVGAFLPWASALGVKALGTEGNGLLTLSIVVLGLALLPLASKLPRMLYGLQAVLGGLVAVVGFYDMSGLPESMIAVGLSITAIGGVVWCVAALAALFRNWSAPPRWGE